MTRADASRSPRPHAGPLPGVQHVLAVSAGKGGVGKSTTTINLAAALSLAGLRVGVLDADILGPSVRAMLGTSGRVQAEDDGRVWHPLRAHGLSVMGVDLLVDDEQAPLVWRGAMASQVLEQMLRQTAWGELDVLLIDMPPGTGDVPLSLCQRAPIDAALIVTTPQDVALLDVARGMGMFHKAGVPLLGVVENMAVFVCACCGHASHPFGSGGGDRLAADHGVEVLARLPLDMGTRLQADAGVPLVLAEPGCDASARYRQLAERVWQGLVQQGSTAAVDPGGGGVHIEWSTDA